MAKKKSRQKQPMPGWVWLTAGLMVGLFVAFLVYLKDNYPALSLPDSPLASSKQDTRGVAKTRNQAPTRPPKTRFDFYTILPEMEIAIPDDEIGDNKSQTGIATLKRPGTYVLQAGSFKKHDQADRMKANLALLGIEAKIQSVTINSKDTWHRVRIGPYKNLSEINRIRTRLQKNSINAILLKLKT